MNEREINFEEDKFDFTLPELDSILYGYTRGDQNAYGNSVAFALSNLKLTDSLHKEEKIKGLILPEGLAIRHTKICDFQHCGIFCETTLIPKGTKFGPLKGKLNQLSGLQKAVNNQNLQNCWEIFGEDCRNISILELDFDGDIERKDFSNDAWMRYVNPARYFQEQNVICTQSEDFKSLFFEISRDISQGTELLVWYSEDTYELYLGLPTGLIPQSNAIDPTWQEKTEGFQCIHCEKVFAYKYYLDKHLKYTRCVDQGDRKFPCHLCSRSFEKKDRLRIHVLHVHDKHRPHKCRVCEKSFSQSSSLNKHIRVHSGERPYKCVYCSKAFTASSILRTHMRQHSGEKPFKCKFCGKAFASHAAHDSHVRRNHPAPENSPSADNGTLSFHRNEPNFVNGHHNIDKSPIVKTMIQNVEKIRQMPPKFRQTPASLTNSYPYFKHQLNGPTTQPMPLNVYNNCGTSYFFDQKPT